jgi:hypothetical protein
MKKFIFSLFFFSFLVVGAQAQKCSKTCTKSATAASCQTKAPSSVATTATAPTSEEAMVAAKMASLDPSIETRSCPVTGNVSYVRKETCAHSGKVSFVDVSYDATTSTFVNVSPKAEGAGCNKSTATSGKSCSSNAAAGGKSCCAGKGTAAKAEKVKS